MIAALWSLKKHADQPTPPIMMTLLSVIDSKGSWSRRLVGGCAYTPPIDAEQIVTPESISQAFIRT